LTLYSPEILDQITRRGVQEIISRDEFVRMLQEGKPLRLKMGFDPSRPDIHLGHVVGLRKLHQLQKLGHQVILVVGDWTAQIGDPSGQSATRPILTHDEVIANAESYLRQFFKVVDQDRTQVVWQSEWFGKFTLADVIQLTSRFTVAQFLERDDFAKRFQEHRPIAITELLYPLLQAYDSVAIESDVEFGGTDQMFNLLVGRELQGMMGQKPQQCVLMPILVGTDGVQKMSKSLDNYVGVEEPPNDMYGKLMSLPDQLIVPYFDYLTDTPDRELAEMKESLAARAENPMQLKKRLAWEITTAFHDRGSADAAQAHFERVVQRRELPEEMPESLCHMARGERWSAALVGTNLASSTSEAKRLINQGAVHIISPTGATRRLTGDATADGLEPGTAIRAGRRKYVHLIAGDVHLWWSRKLGETFTTRGEAEDYQALPAANHPTVIEVEIADDHALGDINKWEILAFEREILDLNSDFTTDTFNAPSSAIYQFDIDIEFANWDQQASRYDFALVTSNRSYGQSFTPVALKERLPLYITEVAQMDAGDTALLNLRQVGGHQSAIIKAGSRFRVRALAQ